MEERLDGLEKKLKSMTAMLWVILFCTSMTFGFVFKKLNMIQNDMKVLVKANQLLDL